MLQKLISALFLLVVGVKLFPDIAGQRIRFLVRHMEASLRKKDLHYLAHALYLSLSKVANVSRITCEKFKKPGYALYSDGTKGPICWEAPVAFTIYIDGVPTFGLGVEFVGNTLNIRQLQGVYGVPVPESLRRWPRILIEACCLCARTRGIRYVRVYRADQSVFFKYPITAAELDRDMRQKYVAEHQQRMRRRYDGTARQMKLRMKKKYAEWENPTYARS